MAATKTFNSFSGFIACRTVARRTRQPREHRLWLTAILSGLAVMVGVEVTADDDSSGGAQVSLAEPILPAVGTASIDFSRDIRPLLSDACFACHGPDEQNREADLRLDRPGSHVIQPGDTQASELLARILSDDPDLQMPPPHSGKQLSPEAIELFLAWIDQGAPFTEHWAFALPVKPPLPIVNDASWPRTAIDSFVLARLEQQRLSPAASADRAALLRRLYLDLIGLPPTPDEISDFLADRSPAAYQQTVDRLLQSVHYGERWGRIWLDAARYADSDGFEKDKPRSVWFYRDWVIRALNTDLPYDEFIVKQIAGDLLPEPTQDDLVATGFLRNSMVNEEGGVDPEQFRMEAMFDRIDAIGKSILGLTIQCAQCHSHKYDPISHEDYYGLFAFINNAHEACITVFTPAEQAEREATLAQIDAITSQYLDSTPDALARLSQWEAAVKQAKQSDWLPVEIAFIAETIGGQKFLRQADGSYLAAGYAPTRSHPSGEVVISSLEKITAIRIEMLCDPNLPHAGPGRSIDGTWALSELELSSAKLDPTGQEGWEKRPWAEATATIQLPKTALSERYHDKTKSERFLGSVEMAIDGDNATAWHGDRGPGRRNDPQTAMFVLAEPLVAPRTVQTTGKDETEVAEQPDEPIRFRIKLSQMHGGWNSDDYQNHNLGRYRISVTSSDQPAIEPLPPRVMTGIEKPFEDRTQEERRLLLSHFIESQSDLQVLAQRLEDAWQRYPKGSSQLVLAERQTLRPTRRLQRGEFLKPQEAVQPAIPAVLRGAVVGDLDGEQIDGSPQPLNRLDFAHWLASPNNPLTARSIVNRVWQEYFGTGITATSDDLGLQGEPPSHPDLLDYLATDLIESGWSLKSLHRQIVLSASYQQDSTLTPERLDIDPQNRLLARGPRLRVPAETVRDIALAASGLLNASVGGPPVYPPAPEFLFQPPASYGPKTWAHSSGGDAFRRALYTFRFRSVPYPVLETFDAPNGDVSCVRRSLSNTPLQALTTLNEPLFLDCARQLARQAMQIDNDSAAIEYLFVSCTSRSPAAEERTVLQDLLNQQRERFAADVQVAKRLTETESEKPISDEAATQQAAWTVLCRVVLNLDETITKP